ncbi:MAG: 2OG-Fe(II) oxygenase [Ferruginibacter sp.]
MQEKIDLLIDSYLQDNIGITKDFLNKELTKGLYKHIHQLKEDNLMINSGIGNDEHKDADQKMRSDKIYWMDKSHENKYEREFLQLAEDFISRLNNTCYTGINDYEFHYAVYEKGSFYRRHKDQFKTDNNRKYSFICYLNENWLEEDGGQLIVYHDNHTQKIQPHASTAVFFKADEMEHEVMISQRQRMSISGWLKQV